MARPGRACSGRATGLISPGRGQKAGAAALFGRLCFMSLDVTLSSQSIRHWCWVQGPRNLPCPPETTRGHALQRRWSGLGAQLPVFLLPLLGGPKSHITGRTPKCHLGSPSIYLGEIESFGHFFSLCCGFPSLAALSPRAGLAPEGPLGRAGQISDAPTDVPVSAGGQVVLMHKRPAGRA